MRLAVVGARGQLGAAVLHECAPHHDTVGFTRADLDVTDDLAIARALEKARPDVIVNGAAYNDVDGAEDRPVHALELNALAVKALARAADGIEAVLIHFSSDFVFDGRATRPYTETDPPNPRSVYATSKLLGEWFALDARRAYVVRVESLFGQSPNGAPARGTVANIMTALLAGGSPRIFEDRTVSPTYIPDAARAIRQLIESQPPPGLYHCVNSGSCTWLEFALELATQFGVEPRLTPVRMSDVTLRAARPLYCALCNEKLRSAGIEMPSWKEAVGQFARDARARAEHGGFVR